MNCWEFINCGREKGGVNEKDLGVCPAYPNYGKMCARVPGTMCRGEIEGSYTNKLSQCLICNFYNSKSYKRTV